MQGGDTQDQNLLQFFLNMVEFGMNVQQAVEAPNINSYQMRSSFGAHKIEPGRLTLNESTPPGVRGELAKMGYTLDYQRLTSGPDQRHLLRLGARDVLGRIEQPRRGLRHRLVGRPAPAVDATSITRGVRLVCATAVP